MGEDQFQPVSEEADGSQSEDASNMSPNDSSEAAGVNDKDSKIILDPAVEKKFSIVI